MPLSNDRSTLLPAARATPIVFVVDDDFSVRNALELLIDSAGWQAQTFPSAVHFLECARLAGPSCLILDVTLPHLDGLELQKRLNADGKEMPIIFISAHGDVPMTVQAMKAGALDFLTKPLSSDALLDAIQRALDFSRAALDRDNAMRGLRECHALLSRREREVMALVAAGLLNKQVGAELGISEITVKAHRGSVMRKMQATSFADLVDMARWLGIPRSGGVSRSRSIANSVFGSGQRQAAR